jgi:hypothetical protein
MPGGGGWKMEEGDHLKLAALTDITVNLPRKNFTRGGGALGEAFIN